MLGPTQRLCARRQIHILHIRDGAITAHRANRDDLGMLQQPAARRAARERTQR